MTSFMDDPLVGDSFRVSFKWVVYNQYKAIGCSYTVTECKSQHMLHILALLGLVTNYGEGGGASLLY